ncbi:hypothetical protein SBOR_5348 [Sclerotinia borealis F-4128]|uniref:Uncharacterized protein n=1 Tax=Sclerotinia borealis (strain F-4128) TaxID=1432307 RepID=W9CIC2_SCLBF|nr:hypothetical protein SBOR_5348 [Sclerotinia borealis F-4128]
MEIHSNKIVPPTIESSNGSPIINSTFIANTQQQDNVSLELNDMPINYNSGRIHAIRDSCTELSVENSNTANCIDVISVTITKQQPGMVSPFFKRIPLEVRNEIYKLLLVNSILGTSESVGYHQFGRSSTVTPPQYDLEPQILRVSHAMYQEASVIFFMEMTPITRHYKKIAPNYFHLYQHPAITKVRHGKVVVSSLKEKLVDGALAPIGLEKPYRFNYGSRTSKEICSYINNEVLLAPLRMLRGVQRVEFRYAIYDELPPVYPYNEHWQQQHTSILPGLDLETDLKTLMMSNSPAERLGDMYERLINYAEAFEFIQKLKVDMRYGEYSLIYEALESQRQGPYGVFEIPISQHIGNLRVLYGPERHPVEEALHCAKKAWIKKYDGVAFKIERAKVVKYLERQYQRAAFAAMDVAEFVKSQKREYYFLNAFPLHNWREYGNGLDRNSATGVVLLESYEKALQRDISFTERVKQRCCAYENAPFYSALPRNILIKQTNDAFDARNYQQCADTFKKAVDDMDTQYLQIRKARKALFEADITPDASCNIDLELWRVDEMIDWSVNEPEMYPASKPME